MGLAISRNPGDGKELRARVEEQEATIEELLRELRRLRKHNDRKSAVAYLTIGGGKRSRGGRDSRPSRSSIMVGAVTSRMSRRRTSSGLGGAHAIMPGVPDGVSRLSEESSMFPGSRLRSPTAVAVSRTKKSREAIKKRRKDRREEVSAAPWSPLAGEMAGIVDEAQFKRVAKPARIRAMLAKAVNSSILFANLGQRERTLCIDAFEPVRHGADVDVIRQGDPGDAFYVVTSGALDILIAGSPEEEPEDHGQLLPGMSFGELALLYNTPRAATIRTEVPSEMWFLDRETYHGVVMYYKVKQARQLEMFLREVPMLRTLNNTELARLAAAMEEESFADGSTIIREGEAGDFFAIIKAGSVVYSKKNVDTGEDEVVGEGGQGDFFGERALIDEDTRKATVRAKGHCAVLVLGREDFNTMLGSLDDIMRRRSSAAAVGHASERDESVEPAEARLHETESFRRHHKRGVMLKDLEMKATLGKGAFGRVKLVRHRPTGELFALKCMAKVEIVKQRLQDHVINERNCMQMVAHPFILKLHNMYQDKRFVYLLLELCLGGELFTFLRKAKRFGEKASRFYAASVVSAFQEIHNKSLAYRDLKPENIVLDNKGYIKVIDFGLAKRVKDRTWTLCGTPDYLAPEIILSLGHNRAVDYWALGVLIYEMVVGHVPFTGPDAMSVYKAVCAGDLRFPTYMSRNCMSLISKLLTPNQNKRLGTLRGGIRDVVKHRWFAGFDWDGLSEYRLKPPIQPIVRAVDDTSNFSRVAVDDVPPPESDWNPDF